MPRYIARCGYQIEFQLTVAIPTIEDGQDNLNKWIDDYTDGRDDEYKESYAQWLAEEAIRQAEKVVEGAVILKGEDPPGVSISEQGLDNLEIEEEVSDWSELFDYSQQGELNRSYLRKLLVSAFSSADITLQKNKSEEALYDEADLRSQNVAELLTDMIRIEGNLPPGWKLVGGFKVELDDVSIYEEKRWWDKNLKELDGAYRPRFIDRPIKRTNYRRR